MSGRPNHTCHGGYHPQPTGEGTQQTGYSRTASAIANQHTNVFPPQETGKSMSNNGRNNNAKQRQGRHCMSVDGESFSHRQRQYSDNKTLDIFRVQGFCDHGNSTSPPPSTGYHGYPEAHLREWQPSSDNHKQVHELRKAKCQSAIEPGSAADSLAYEAPWDVYRCQETLFRDQIINRYRCGQDPDPDNWPINNPRCGDDSLDHNRNPNPQAAWEPVSCSDGKDHRRYYAANQGNNTAHWEPLESRGQCSGRHSNGLTTPLAEANNACRSCTKPVENLRQERYNGFASDVEGNLRHHQQNGFNTDTSPCHEMKKGHRDPGIASNTQHISPAMCGQGKRDLPSTDNGLSSVDSGYQSSSNSRHKRIEDYHGSDPDELRRQSKKLFYGQVSGLDLEQVRRTQRTHSGSNPGSRTSSPARRYQFGFNNLGPDQLIHRGSYDFSLIQQNETSKCSNVVKSKSSGTICERRITVLQQYGSQESNTASDPDQSVSHCKDNLPKSASQDISDNHSRHSGLDDPPHRFTNSFSANELSTSANVKHPVVQSLSRACTSSPVPYQVSHPVGFYPVGVRRTLNKCEDRCVQAVHPSLVWAEQQSEWESIYRVQVRPSNLQSYRFWLLIAIISSYKITTWFCL